MLGSALVLGAVALPAPAPAANAELEPTEKVELDFPSRHGFDIYVEVRPLLGVVVIGTEKGPGRGVVRGRSSSAGYAARVPIGPAEGRLDFEVPGVASISGELVTLSKGHGEASAAGCPESAATSEAVEFRGSFDFTGSGGYLSFDADHGEGGVERTAGRLCEEGTPEIERPSLFSYLEADLGFSSQNTSVLYSKLSSPGRVTNFVALHRESEGKVEFEAQSLEWLPNRVASDRTLDVGGAPGPDFKVSSKAEHPASARVRPPAPFSGSGHYSRVRGKLTGTLSVDILGKRVPLAGERSKAGLFNFQTGF